MKFGIGSLNLTGKVGFESKIKKEERKNEKKQKKTGGRVARGKKKEGKNEREEKENGKRKLPSQT